MASLALGSVVLALQAPTAHCPLPSVSYVHGNLDDYPCKALGAHNQEWMTKGCFDFLDAAANGDKPFFLYYATTLDHGPHSKARSLLDDPRKTPLIMRWPGRIPPGETASLVHTTDLFPTVLDLCGIQKAPELVLDGASLRPVLKDRNHKLRDALLLEWGPTRGVVTDTHKYIAVRHPESVISRTGYEQSVREFRQKTSGLSVKQLTPEEADAWGIEYERLHGNASR